MCQQRPSGWGPVEWCAPAVGQGVGWTYHGIKKPRLSRPPKAQRCRPAQGQSTCAVSDSLTGAVLVIKESGSPGDMSSNPSLDIMTWGDSLHAFGGSIHSCLD